MTVFARIYGISSVSTDSQVRIEFSSRLRRLRLEHGYPHARAFAEAIGIEENRYTRYERGEVEPNLAVIAAICRTLGITPNEPFGYERIKMRACPSCGGAGVVPA
jgi:transcriptional regulator with XRE-family HTH domain